MPHDPMQIQQLARAYTEAWCSRDPAQVARHYVPGGTIAINGGEATGIAEVAESFIAALPDIEVLVDYLVIREDGGVEYRWTFTGTSAETGKSVCVPGYEEWSIAADGLIAESRGHYRPSRVRPPAPARHRLDHLAQLGGHSRCTPSSPMLRQPRRPLLTPLR